MKDDLKIKLGAIFLAVGTGAFLLSMGLGHIAMISPLAYILLFLPPIGYGLLMSGLSYRNKGIMLIINGIIFMVPMWIHGIILIDNPIPWMDLVTIIYIFLHLFLALIFIFPAIYLMYTHMPSPKTQYNNSLVGWTIGISILTLICTTIVTMAGGAIATSSHDINFRYYFFHNFGYCLGLGFLLSSLLIGFGYLLQGAEVHGYSLPSGASLPTS